MRNNFFEMIVGTFVLVCAVYFFTFSYKKVNNVGTDKYELAVAFDNADGVDTGTDVKISGVKIGSVASQELDNKTYRAKLKLSIDNDVKLSEDSSAKIVSSGLIGSKYIMIEPGGSDEMLKSGDEIKFSQSSINFEELLGKFIFSDKDKNKEKANAEADVK
jgi:phospholipid/cholesterol/gamma-HCH transport system substrate-binding protein